MSGTLRAQSEKVPKPAMLTGVTQVAAVSAAKVFLKDLSVLIDGVLLRWSPISEDDL